MDDRQMADVVLETVGLFGEKGLRAEWLYDLAAWLRLTGQAKSPAEWIFGAQLHHQNGRYSVQFYSSELHRGRETAMMKKWLELTSCWLKLTPAGLERLYELNLVHPAALQDLAQYLQEEHGPDWRADALRLLTSDLIASATPIVAPVPEPVLSQR